MTKNVTTATERLDRIVDMFAGAPKDLRLQALLDYSRRLPQLPDRLTERPELFEIVPECQSPFALIVEQDNELVRLFFRVPAEAPTVRGYASILHEALDGSPAQEIIDVPNDFYTRLRYIIEGTLPRINGMAAILRRIKTQVAALNA